MYPLNKDYIKLVKAGQSSFDIKNKKVWLYLWYVAQNPCFGY